MGDTQTALEQEENKAKQEHRQRLKLEQLIAELEEKLAREIKVSHCTFSAKRLCTLYGPHWTYIQIQ